MIRAIAGALLIAAAGAAPAQEAAAAPQPSPEASADAAKLGGFVGLAWNSIRYGEAYPFPYTPPQRADYEGGGFGLSGGLRFAPGIEARVDYTRNKLSPPTLNTGEASLEEINAEASWRSPEFRIFSAALRGGYRQLSVDWDYYDHHDRLHGPFAGVDLRARVLPAVALDAGYARLFLRDGAGSNPGRELRLGLVVGAGPLDVIVRTRRMTLDDPASGFDKDLREIMIGVGLAWGYPHRRSPLMPPTPKQKRPHPPKL